MLGSLCCLRVWVCVCETKCCLSRLLRYHLITGEDILWRCLLSNVFVVHACVCVCGCVCMCVCVWVWVCVCVVWCVWWGCLSRALCGCVGGGGCGVCVCVCVCVSTVKGWLIGGRRSGS